MAVKRVIALLGEPLYNEDGVATVITKPGHLVTGVTEIKPHDTAAGDCPRTFALERSEMGSGIDNTYQTAYSLSSDYAVGDYVKVGSFAPGMRVLAWIASGQNITENAFLESAGDGTLRVFNAGVKIARALESVNCLAQTLAHIRVEVY